MEKGTVPDRPLLALLVMGLGGIETELLLIAHYDSAPQLIPIVLIAVTLAALGWFWFLPGPSGRRMLQILMGSLVVAGLAGMVLHYRGSLAFQVETDPTRSTMEYMTKVLRAETPPVLAPGVMAQLGLLGLLYTHRNPAPSRGRGVVNQGDLS